MKTLQVVDGILQRVENRSDMSPRKASRVVIVPKSTVWKVLGNEGLHQYHAQKIQDLTHVDYAPLVQFGRCILQQLAV